MVDENTRKANARAELVNKHGESLRELLGSNFEEDFRFIQAVNEVAAGRCPQFVIMELRGH